MVGFYVTTYLSLILFRLIGLETTDSWFSTLLTSFLTIPLLYLVYGLKIIAEFYGVIILLDLIGFSIFKNRVKKILFFETILITPPFIAWAFEYQYWLWITLSISLGVTQYIRIWRIERINQQGLKN